MKRFNSFYFIKNLLEVIDWIIF